MSFKVGVGGFEPPTSWSQTMRANQAALHPVFLNPVVPLAGLEPTHLAPEASALSSELQGHKCIILFPHRAFKQAFCYQQNPEAATLLEFLGFQSWMPVLSTRVLSKSILLPRNSRLPLLDKFPKMNQDLHSGQLN